MFMGFENFKLFRLHLEKLGAKLVPKSDYPKLDKTKLFFIETPNSTQVYFKFGIYTL